MTRRDVIDAINECEKKGIFDVHVDPISQELIIPVTDTYHYPNLRTFLEKVKFRLQKIFIVWPFTWYQNRVVFKTEIIGQENLKGLTAAVLTCNHVAKFDCLVIKYAARGHRTYTIAAPFNNMRGWFGDLMRAGDMLPMSEHLHGQRNFNNMVDDVLTKEKQFIVMYPEAAMWWHYKKPRPYKVGAFHIAAKYNVPVVPEFITYRDSGKTEAEGQPHYYFTLHIMPPIWPKPELSFKENKEYLCKESFTACREVYEKVYGIPLEYTCDNQF